MAKGFRNLLLTLFTATATFLLAQPALAQQGQPGVDSDGDGVNDALDAEPCNANVSARVYVPADRAWGMMLFEDTWPARGDFDFNDAVIAYNQVLRYDSSARLTGVRMELSVMAVGAGALNGLALRLPNTPPSMVTSLTSAIGGAVPGLKATLDPAAAEATIILSENLHALFGTTATREYVNTDPSLPLRPYVDLTLEIGLAPGANLSAADAPFDLFIFDGYRGTEVHRPRYRATAAMNAALYNTADDGSTTTRSFVTTQGIPFALEFPELVNYPRELAAIDSVYPSIVPFGLSSGLQHGDYYRNLQPQLAFGLTPPRALSAQAAADLSCFTPNPGVCGSATGSGSTTAPELGLCSFGVHSQPVATGGLWRWDCTGHYSQPTACTTPAWICQPNLVSPCSVSGGSGTKTCNGSGTGYGTCTVTACDSGFNLVNGQCVPQVCQPGTTRSCTANGGTGTQTCDNLGTAWGSCNVTYGQQVCPWNANLFPLSYSAPGGPSVAGMTFDNHCNLWFSNNGNQVFRAAYNTNQVSLVHTFPNPARGAAYRASDNTLYFAVMDRIYAMNPSTRAVTQLSGSTGMGSWANHMVVAPANWGSYGNQLIVAHSNGRIYAFNPSTGVLSTVGTVGGPLSSLVFDGQTLYFTNYNANAVQVMSPTGAVSNFGTLPCPPDGIALRAGQRIFAGCGAQNLLYSLTIPGGAVTQLAQVSGNASWAPWGMIYDGGGGLIVMGESPAQLLRFAQ